MIKTDKHIEIVCSTDKTLSSMSLQSRNAILSVLSRCYTNVGITIVNTPLDLKNLVAQKPDLVFLGMKFVPQNIALGRDDPDKIWLARYLDNQGIAYTGSSQRAHELELNKHLAKQCIINAGLKTSPFYVAEQNQPHIKEDMLLTFPLFIKPTDRGGGLGIDHCSIAHNFEALESKIESITTNFQSDSLVEEYLPGREFSVAVLKNEYSEGYSVMPIELIAPLDEHGDRVLSARVKSADVESVTKVIDQHIKASISTLALAVFKALDARDYGRIDIRMDQFGTPQFLEANLIPSLIDNYGNFPKACLLNLGLGYEAMLLQIVQLALKRDNKMRATTHKINIPNFIPLQPALEI